MPAKRPRMTANRLEAVNRPMTARRHSGGHTGQNPPERESPDLSHLTSFCIGDTFLSEPVLAFGPPNVFDAVPDLAAGSSFFR